MANETKSTEIGSEFDWPGLLEGPFLPWSSPFLFMALGRDAIPLLFKKTRKYSRTVFIPDYFCHEVSLYWKKNGIKIRYYQDDPRWVQPDWGSLSPKRGDFVLAVNYFGVKNGMAWQRWKKNNPGIVLVEDHSHDPLSTWARNSNADYAFASLRKTFPAPDGAILWSPRKFPLPAEPENRNCAGSALKLAAMIWKTQYLNSQKNLPYLKEIYRKLQVEGERYFLKNTDLRISDWSRFLLLKGFPAFWRKSREKNVRLLLRLLESKGDFEPLFQEWPKGHCPFNLILVFKTHALRETFRSGLIHRGIFTPVHWQGSAGDHQHVMDLACRILTIPVDHRYGKKEMGLIAKTISKITRSK